MRHLLLIAIIFICSGCIPTKQITPSSDGGSFILKEDIVEFYEGAFGDRSLIGLLKGEYIAVGHDEDGIYYRGPHKCLVLLNEEQGRHFLATGERPGAMDNPREVNVLTGDEGGLFVPYDLDNEELLYFHYADYRNITGETDSKIPPRPASSLNSPNLDSKPADAVFMLPNVRIVNPNDPNALPSGEAAVGGAIGVTAGRQLGLSALKRAQGGIISGFLVKNDKILDIVRAARANQPASGTTRKPQ